MLNNLKVDKVKNLKTNKKVNLDSLDFDTVVVSDLTGMEYKVSSMYREFVFLKDEYSHEYKRKQVSWKELEFHYTFFKS